MKKNLLFLVFISVFCTSFSQEYKMLEKKLDKHVGNVNAVSISPDGLLLASGSDDKTVKVWNLQTGELVLDLLGHVRPVKTVLFSNDGLSIFSAGDRNIRITDKSGTFIKSLVGHATDVWSIGLSPDSRKLVSGSYEKKYKVWDVTTAKAILSPEGHNQNVLAVCYSPDGRFIASGSLDLTVCIWDAETGKQIHQMRGHSGNIFCVKFSPDSKYVLSTSNDKTIKIWDVATGKTVRTLAGHKEAVMSACFSPDGKHILSASFDKTIILWGATDGKEIYNFNEHKELINAVCFASDGVHFASAGNNGELFYWKIDARIYVDAYFKENLTNETAQSILFNPKRDSEKPSEYKERQVKQEEFKKMLYEKYYNQYVLMIKNRNILEIEEGDVKIKYE